MTAALDFAALPPEINSARMYTGAGSGPMLAAASAWNEVAAELRATALSYQGVLSALTGEEWFGPAAATMAAAALPYVAWMSATAGEAERTAVQAEAAAGAYEAAFAAMVPPPLIAANRAQLATLIATNILGQNTPAIAATESQYLEMWAQDAATMYGYAGSSAVATELSPFVEPLQATSSSGLAAQAVAVNQAAGTSATGQQSALSQLISAVPGALQGLSGSNSGTGLSDLTNLLLTGTGPAGWDGVMQMWGPNANIWNTITSTGAFTPGATVGTLSSLFGASATSDVAGTAQGVAPSAIAAVSPLESAGGMRGLIVAGVGDGGIVGKLSVPPTWTAAAPLSGSLHSALGGTPMVAPGPAGTAGMPGVPLGNLAGQPFGRAVPQYGFRPSFVTRPPAAG
jgi:PPE-repeat protein